MADTKISAAADAGTLLAADMLPLARSGDTSAYHATVAEIATFANGAYVPNYATANPSMDGAASPGTAITVSRGDHVHPVDTSRAPLNSPAFTGSPVLPGATTGFTQSTADSSTKLATTAYVQGAMVAAGAGVSSFNTRTGNVTLSSADVEAALAFAPAPLASPVFTGNPTAPTPAPGDNDTSIATTEFVAAAVVGITAGVSSFNTRTGAVTLSSTDVSGASGLLTTGGAMTGGLSFGSTVGSGVSDTSRHVSLYGGSGTSGTFGFNVTSGRINYSVPVVSHVHSFNVAGVEEVRIGNTGISLLNTGWISGLLAPTANDHAATKAYVDTTISSAVAPALNNVGRNLLHNALFNVAQRGAGPWTASGAYTADRWQQWIGSGDTINTVVNITDDTVRGQIGDEAAAFVVYSTFTGAAGAANLVLLQQKIEKVRRLSGKTVTISLWAAANSGTPRLGLSMDQDFGNGGSPSAGVSGVGQSFTISTTWTRYSRTFTIPSAASKTLGTNGDDKIVANLWYSAGSNYATASGSVGVQGGAIAIWGIQLEIGSVATPLEKLDPRMDLTNCQRFYCILGNIALSAGPPGTAAGQQTYGHVTLPVTMRAVPTVGVPVQSSTNCSAAAPLNQFAQGFDLYITSLAAGSFYATLGPLTASADL
jgi:Carbohydrate binding domain